MKKIACIALVCLLAGCVRVPVQSIKLNQIVRDNIQDLHQKHINLAHEYFKLKIELFDTWFLERYEPAFKANYQKVWNQKKPNDQFDLAKDAHRRQYIQDSVAEHEELVSQIKGLESDLVTKLDTGYSDLIRANEAVTALLESAERLTDEERKLWNNTVGKVFPAFEAEKIDTKIADLQDKAIKAIGGN